MIYITGIVVILIVICVFIVLFNYFKLNDIRTSIETCSNSIDDALNKKFDLIENLLKKIDNDKIKNDFVYDNEASLYEREDVLFNTSFEINKFIKESKNKKLKDQIKDLNVLEETLDGLKDFYNTNVLNYNEIFLKKIFNKIFKLLKFDNYKSFKIRKLEEYEIFKN